MTPTLNQLLATQRQWSEATFGPACQLGPEGPLRHLLLELDAYDGVILDKEEILAKVLRLEVSGG